MCLYYIIESTYPMWKRWIKRILMFSKLFSTLKIWRVEKFTILFFKLKSLYRISWFYSKAKIITAGICIFLIKVCSCSVENIQILYTMDCALVNFWQYLHLSLGFWSILWIFLMCLVSVSYEKNNFPHCVHCSSLTFSWSRLIWVLRLLFSVYSFPQSHLWSFLPSWSCILRCLLMWTCGTF